MHSPKSLSSPPSLNGLETSPLEVPASAPQLPTSEDALPSVTAPLPHEKLCVLQVARSLGGGFHHKPRGLVADGVVCVTRNKR